jgi:hypothetical protein
MTTIHKSLYCLLPMTCKLTKGLSNPCTICLFVPMLIYHLWVYIYLGHLAGGTSFYTGCMYAFNYAGTSVAYWIICRQSQATYINEIMSIIWHDKDWNDKEGSHYQLLNYNLGILSLYKKAYNSFKRYCICWERLLKILFAIWFTITFINIILTILHDTNTIISYESFDDKPLGLWGYYNLSGQIIAALSILTCSSIMMTGFYQLKCMTTGFAYKLREYRDSTICSEEIPTLTHTLRREYLSIQASYLAYSDLWSVPILVSLTFCTQVAIASIFVIHYSVQECVVHGDCESIIIFPFIWLFAAFAIMGIILKSIANVNEVTSLIKDVFIYTNGAIENISNDYTSIGGRSVWLSYLEYNPLSLSICGTVITTKLVVNTGYTIGVAIGSFLASNIFG